MQQALEETRPAVGIVRFIADQPGTYAVYCNICCGYGYVYQRVEITLS
jgi:heme/copper-type cytochrome/quinol oxidase subunit 2